MKAKKSLQLATMAGLLLMGLLSACTTKAEKQPEAPSYEEAIQTRAWETVLEAEDLRHFLYTYQPENVTRSTSSSGETLGASTSADIAFARLFADLSHFLTLQTYQTPYNKDGIKAIVDFSILWDKASGQVSISRMTIARTDGSMPQEIYDAYMFGLAYLLVHNNYDLDETRPEGTPFVSTLIPEEGTCTAEKGGHYLISCEGGSEDGKSLTVKDNSSGWIKGGKFIKKCTEGGGCAKVCQADLALVL